MVCVSSLFRPPGHGGQHCVLFAAAQAGRARGCCTDGTPQHRRPRGACLPARYGATLPLQLQHLSNTCIRPDRSSNGTHRPKCQCLFCRGRPDRHLLRLPVCRLRAGHSQAAASSEPGNHSAHSQDDRRGGCFCLCVCFCFALYARYVCVCVL